MTPRHRRQVVRDRRRAPAQSQLQASRLPNAAIEPGGTFQFPTAGFTMFEASVYLRYHRPTCPAKCRCAEKALQFCRRHGVKLLQRGRTYLVRQDALDRVLDGQPSDLDAVAAAIAQSNRARRRPQLVSAG